MKLYELLSDVGEYQIFGQNNVNIENLSQNSKKAAKNMLFFCINGTKTNGNFYIDEAVKNGAIAVLSDKFIQPKEINTKLKNTENDYCGSITQIIVPNVRKAMAKICANFYHNPQKKLKIVGVTGTSGKSSTSFLIYEMLRLENKKVGLIGTSGIYFENYQYDLNMTTPDSIDLFEIFSKMVKYSIEYCVMEVSAHAIFFDKIYGIDFAVKVLTNIKSDHLDFFKTRSNYEKVKLSFFNKECTAVINSDDKISKKISKNCPKSIKFGEKCANFLISNIKCELGETSFQLKFHDEIYTINSLLTGKFNVWNITCALAVLYALNLDFQNVIPMIKSIHKIDGRFDVVFKSNGFNVVIDYAHTYDSLENFLNSVNSVSQNINIIVFGAPGERDSTKRFPMGELAGELCDVVILTTDNPASENPRRIMFEMEQGVKETKAQCFLIENRKKAIKKAIKIAKKAKNCNILVVGKGAETYQIVGDKHVPYSDYIAVYDCLSE